jgi:hypothetical protein
MGGAGESIVVNLSVLFTRAAHCQPDAGRKAGVPATEPWSMFLNAFDQPLKQYQVVA